MGRRTIGLSALAGLFFAADLLTFHYVVDDIGAGLATVMGNLQVVIVALVAWLIWGERPRREVLIALPVMLIGVVLISGVIGGIPYGANAQLGVAIGLITAASYAGYLLVIRRASPTSRPAGPVAVATFACMLAAGLFGAVVGDLDLVPSMPAHAYLLAYGVSSQSIGYLLIQVSLPRLPAVLTSAILLAQPVMTVILAIILLGEAPSPGQITGVLLVVLGLALATGTIARVRNDLRGGLSSGGTPA
jgi:drug/metabolite transporter (DMT)-like permease